MKTLTRFESCEIIIVREYVHQMILCKMYILPYDDATRMKICRILQSFNVTLLCKCKYCAFVVKLFYVSFYQCKE